MIAVPLDGGNSPVRIELHKNIDYVRVRILCNGDDLSYMVVVFPAPLCPKKEVI